MIASVRKEGIALFRAPPKSRMQTMAVPCLTEQAASPRKNKARAVSSVGRVSVLHTDCRGFESLTAHQKTFMKTPQSVADCGVFALHS